MLEHVMLWVQTYGYFALGGLLGLGIVGLPIPEETLLAYSGYLVAAGKLALPWTIAAGVVGSWVGVSVSYVIGRTAGEALLAWLGGRSPRWQRHIDIGRRWFNRVGKWLVGVAYFVPGVRHVGALLAGASGLRVGTFAAIAYPAGLIWVCLFVLAGYWLGQRWMEAPGQYRVVAAWIAVGAAAAAGCYGLWRVARRK